MKNKYHVRLIIIIQISMNATTARSASHESVSIPMEVIIVMVVKLDSLLMVPIA